MTSLTGSNPNSLYGDILTTTNNGQGLSTTLQNLQDAFGNNSPVQIASNAINFNRTGGRSFQLDGVPLTISATILNQLGPSSISGTLSIAQIRAMSGASILLIGAPGAGSIVLIEKFVISSGTNYTDGGLIYLQYSDNGTSFGENSASSTISSAVITSGTNRISSASGQIGDLGFSSSVNVINSPVCITNDAEGFLNGDSDVNYYISYIIANIS